MEDATSVRKLVEIIFSKEFENAEEMTATDSSISACLLTNDLSDELAEIFPQILQNVLLAKQVIFFYEWENYLNACSDIMFSSHKMYLRCVIFACLYEALYHKNGCEIFISMCALLKSFNENILNSTGMDFRDLNTDIIVLLYDDVLKSSFSEKVGYQKLLEYICCHRYHSLKFQDTASTAADARDALLKNRKVKKELDRRDLSRPEEEIEIIEMSTTFLSRKILERTSVELPPLLNDPDLIKCLKASGNEEKAEKTESDTE